MQSQLRRRLLKAASRLELHYIVFSLATVVAYGGERVKQYLTGYLPLSRVACYSHAHY